MSFAHTWQLGAADSQGDGYLMATCPIMYRYPSGNAKIA